MSLPDHPESPPMTEAVYAAFHRKRAAMMQELLVKCLPGEVNQVLDIGGGANVLGMGKFVKERWGAEMHSVDLGDDGERYGEDGIIYHKANVDHQPLPFDDARFDAVLFASIIEHLYNPDYAIRECARVLKPGGLLLVEAPNAVSFGRRVDVLKGRNPFRFFNANNTQSEKPPMFYCSVFYTVDEVEALLTRYFEVLEWRYGRHVPPIAWWKWLVHETAVALFPRMSDCFAIIARRRTLE